MVIEIKMKKGTVCAESNFNGLELFGFGDSEAQAIGCLLMNFEYIIDIASPNIERLTARALGNFVKRYSHDLGITIKIS